MPKEPEAIANWYDALSTSYDDLYANEQSKKHQKIIETFGERKFERFADVGCGTGRLLELVSTGSLLALGIDLSKQMLIKAKQRLHNLPVQLIRAEASHLPLQDHVADGVVSVSVSEHGPSFPEQFQELSRVATKNAVLSMTVFTDTNRIFHDQLNQKEMELVSSLSDRETLWTRRPNPHRTESQPVGSTLRTTCDRSTISNNVRMFPPMAGKRPDDTLYKMRKTKERFSKRKTRTENDGSREFRI